MPHAHMVFSLDNTYDIDTNNQEDLIDALATLISSLVSENKMKETVDLIDFFPKIHCCTS
jgi:hypothetical protein